MDVFEVLGQLVGRGWSRAPHLFLFSLLFWIAVGVGLFLRYVRHDQPRSDRVLRLTPLIGVLAVVVAAVDLAVRGTVEVIHPSMAAYLAVPLGVGSRVLDRLDQLHATRTWRRPSGRISDELRFLRSRQVTYVLALVLNMLLATIAGDPFTWDSRVDLERNDPTSLEAVNWLHVVAFIFTAAIVVDLLITLSRVGIRASRGAVRRP